MPYKGNKSSRVISHCIEVPYKGSMSSRVLFWGLGSEEQRGVAVIAFPNSTTVIIVLALYNKQLGALEPGKSHPGQ